MRVNTSLSYNFSSPPPSFASLRSSHLTNVSLQLVLVLLRRLKVGAVPTARVLGIEKALHLFCHALDTPRVVHPLEERVSTEPRVLRRRDRAGMGSIGRGTVMWRAMRDQPQHRGSGASPLTALRDSESESLPSASHALPHVACGSQLPVACTERTTHLSSHEFPRSCLDLRAEGAHGRSVDAFRVVHPLLHALERLPVSDPFGATAQRQPCMLRC